MRKLLFALLLLPVLSFAQGTATNIRNGSSLPTACANGDIFYKTTAPIGAHECAIPGNPGTWRRLYPTSATIIALFSGTCDNTTWLRGDGACAAPAGSGPGGSSTHVQINDSGSFYGDSQFTYDKSTHIVGVGDGSTRATIDLLGAAGAPSNPSGSRCRIYFNTTSGLVEFVNSSGSSCGPAGNAGTVTHTGSLTSTQLVCGNGSADITSCNLSGDATTSSSAVVTVVKVNGVSHAASPSTDSVEIVTASNTATAKVIPDCTDSGGNHLNYTQSTHTLSCGTSSSGGGGGGGLTLVEQHTASSSASLDFTSCISSTYDEYEIHFVALVPASTGVSLQMRMSTNGGSSYDTSGSNYKYGMLYSGIGDSPTQTSGNTSSAINLTNSTSTQSSYTTNGSIRLFAPGGSNFKFIEGKTQSVVSTGNIYQWGDSGAYLSTTAVNAFQFFFSSGNIASGTIRCYGIAK